MNKPTSTSAPKPTTTATPLELMRISTAIDHLQEAQKKLPGYICRRAESLINDAIAELKLRLIELKYEAGKQTNT